MKIIEGAMERSGLEEAQKGSGWERLIVRSPEQSADDTIPVLIVPVEPGFAEEARAKIDEALRGRADRPDS